MIDRVLRRSPHLALLAAVVPFVVLALWALRAPLDLSIGDQAQYLIHARSILEGRAYTDNGYIHYAPVPVSPAAYPPGLPLLVALVQALGGTIMLLRVMMLSIAAGSLYAAGRYLSALEEWWAGPATVFVCALLPQLPLYATGVYTDFAFTGLVWTCCLLVDRPEPWTRSRVVALTLCGVLAIAFRTAAIALIPALVVHQAWRAFRHGESRTRALVPLVVWVVAYATLDHLFPATAGYVDQINGAVASGPAQPALLVVARLVLKRVLEYRSLLTSLQPSPTPWSVPNAGYHLVVLLLAVLGGVHWIRRARVRFLFCFAAFYLGILIVMPWPSSRFLWPLLPMLWYGTVLGGRKLIERFAGDRGRAIRLALAAAALIAMSARAFGPPTPSLTGIGDLPEGRELYAALGRMGADSALRLGFFNPRDAARLRGVTAMSIPNRPPDGLLEDFSKHRIAHVVVGSMGTDQPGDSAMRRALAERPARFEKEFANDSFAIYRIVPAPTGP